MTKPFLICIHDATPAYAQETAAMIKDLAPLIGRRLSLAVVPNWHGKWPLSAAPNYCRLLHESAEVLLLHGVNHQRQTGSGPVTWLTNASDEMNGLTLEDTERMLQEGQSEFVEAFGERARGFVAPAWQQGRVLQVDESNSGLDYLWGFFAIVSQDRRIPLATWTWDCGRWGWLGHVGHGIGRFTHFFDRGVPALAIHPRDLQRGYWPGVLRLIADLLESGYAPATPATLLDGAVRFVGVARPGSVVRPGSRGRDQSSC
jgi:hypothetical protein